YDESLIRELLARNYAFFEEEGMAEIRGGSIVVVGRGGIGSHAAMMLARSGITKIRLVNFDYVTLSSLNRHAAAGLSDVGTPKVICIKRIIESFAKWVDVDARVDVWRRTKEAVICWRERTRCLVNASDNIPTKVDLLKYCHDDKIKVFSAMGAGAKSDPTRIQIRHVVASSPFDISYTFYDPLARSVCRRRRPLGVTSGIPVVYSTEVPSDVKLLPLSKEEFKKGKINELGVFDDFRVRILPVIGPLPSIFGLNAASYILCELAGKPILNPLPVKNRTKTYDRLYRDLGTNESKLFSTTGLQTKLSLDIDNIAFIYEELHRGGRSVFPPFEVPTRATLTRFDWRKPLTVENCVVMELSDAQKHWASWKEAKEKGEVTSWTPEDVWGEEVVEVVKREKEVKEWREAVM
ncbi:hypothetical protein M422DRAFT_159372, partial [Sphaerobolus stellatus SS14]